MKGLGAALLLGSGLWARWLILRRCRERIRAGEELLWALQTLERGVYILRRPLADLVEQCRGRGEVTEPFWADLGRYMAGNLPFENAWQRSLCRLPGPYGSLLAPLGQTLPAGEGLELLHQVREDVYRAVGQERQERGERDRLVTALCLSASLLVTVVLL